MGLAGRLKNLAVKLEISNDSVFGYPIEKQKQYIAHFPEPKDDVQRSYFQYKCQMKFNKPIVTFALNLGSFPLLLLFLLKRSSNIPISYERNEAVFFSDGKPESIIPEVLREEVGDIEVIDDKKELLTKADKKYIYNIWKRYPFSFQFIVKSLLKIRYYSYEIQRLKPRSIIVCNEYSFTSSVLTKYCEEYGIKHINVMHGEKLYYMRDSFFHFHECFVWDEYYRELLQRMRAEQSQFRIAIPPSLKFSKDDSIKKTKEYTYYLGWESGEKLKIIMNAMEQLRRRGFAVAIRPHPRYTDMNEITTLAPAVEVEDYKNITIEQSLKRTKNAISVYSTVLNQAYNNGIGIVIDDISDPKKFGRLGEREYIMLHKQHELLSTLLENTK